jgi:hypothetical protein
MFKKTILVFFVLMSSGIAFAGTKTVALVYDNVSGVNRHAFQFIMQNSRRLGNVSIKSIDASREQPSQDISSYILLNTGVASGIDPVLASFKENIPSGTQVIQLNLYRRREVGNIDVTPDAITSASIWGNRQARNMHGQWIQALGDMLNN